MSTHDLLHQRPMPLHAEPTQSSTQFDSAPVYVLDESPTHVKPQPQTIHPQPPTQQQHAPAGSTQVSDDESEDNYIARRQPLPGIKGKSNLQDINKVNKS